MRTSEHVACPSAVARLNRPAAACNERPPQLLIPLRDRPEKGGRVRADRPGHEGSEAVVVCGAGAAGLAAALAAARAGAEVCLMEARPRLGGTVSHALIH